jgi:hypothetical protein
MAKKMLSKPVTEKKPAAKKTTVKKTYSAAENLKRLAKSQILDDFIERTDCCWNHQAWLDLCAEIEAKGYAPIDFDQVGLILEDKKAACKGECCCGCC